LNAPARSPTRLKRSQHGIHPESVDTGAVEVVTRLQDAGFAAYLVGGCVRDLLLGHEPKDFDVATSATPEQVRELFRRSRLVGRRFRIAHVRMGREVIEVSTFRSSGASEEEDDDRSHSEEGMILRDNVYGTIEEDAFRRDFTVNALYYDPRSEEVIDYVGGLEDLERQRLHFIGDTRRRLREDPVRALRAIRFQAKIGFEVDPEITGALAEAAEGIAAIPPARLFDETLKLLLSGYGAQAWSLLADTPLRAALFPCTNPHDPLIGLAMKNTDDRIADAKPVTPGFMLAVLLWGDYLARLDEHAASLKPAEARFLAASETLSAQQQIMSLPRRFSQFVREVWSLQDRLLEPRARSVNRLLQHPRFRAAYDFLVLRAEVGEPLRDQADWWTSFQEADAEARNQLIEGLGTGEPKRRRKRRRRKSATSDDA
jgi:poly(A) polymerase